MGCGSSFAVDSRTNFNTYSSFETDTTYVFGVIEKFDPSTGQSSNIPKIIELNKQTLTAKEISPPKGLQLFHGSSCLAVSADQIYITGGFNPATGEYTNKSYEYTPSTNSFKELPPLQMTRAYHCSILYGERLYVFGGKTKVSANDPNLKKETRQPKDTSRDFVTSTCEVFDFTTQKWSFAPSLQKARAFAYCCIFKDQIHVFGGMNTTQGKTNRIRTIERFFGKSWKPHNWKLPYGIVNSSIFAHPSEDSLVILGGNYEGKVRWDLELDFENGYLLSKVPLKMSRSNGVGGIFKDFAYIFGGDEVNSIETRVLNQDEWKAKINLVSSQAIRGAIDYRFSGANQPIVLNKQKVASFVKAPENAPTEDVAIVIGDSNNPFILAIDLKNEKISSKPIPTPLALYNNQPGIKLKGTVVPQYLLVGGIQNTNEPVKRTFVYEPFSNKARRAGDLNTKRELSTVIQKGNSVYVIGGRSWNTDEVEIVLNTVERSDITAKKWEVIAPLNIKRYDAVSFLVNDQVYVAGGNAGGNYTFDGKTSTNSLVDLIERYNEAKNVWEVLNIKLKLPYEGALALQSNPNQVVILGGRNGSKDIKKYTFKKEENAEPEEVVVGNLSKGKKNVMGVEFSNGYFILAGGESSYCEIFDKSWKPIAQGFSKKVWQETELLNQGNENDYQLVL